MENSTVKILGYLTGAAIALIVAAILQALPVMLLWNYVVPALFGLRAISFFEALALAALCGMLFKNGISSSVK